MAHFGHETKFLLNEHQIPVHAVVLLSMTMSADAVAGDAQYITLLPSLIMAAWHHKNLAGENGAMGRMRSIHDASRRDIKPTPKAERSLKLLHLAFGSTVD